MKEQELATRALFSQANQPAQQAEALTPIRRNYFRKFEQLLDQAAHGPRWLSEPAVAQLVQAELHGLAEMGVNLLAYCLMPNHVHWLGQLPDEPCFDAARMMQRLKGRTALAANRLLGRQGPFWQPESYDHIVRSGTELARIETYILNNPVKAGLVDDWTEWPYSYKR